MSADASPLASPAVAAAAACHVHKFGGSSLADASLYRAAARLLIADSAATRVVVVSAMQGVTDALIALVSAAREGGDWTSGWQQLRERHRAAAATLDADG